MSIVFLNDKFLPENQAFIPISDTGFTFGEGVFTTIRVENGVPEAYDLHIKRLQNHCNILNIPYPTIKKKWINEIINLNNAKKNIWRLKIIITKSSLVITIKPYTPPKKPLNVGIYSQPITSPHAKIKTLAYLSRISIIEEAKQKGLDDCIALSPEGYILECAFSNVFWTKNNELFTPDPSLPLLFGITIQSIIQENPKIHFVKYKIDELPDNISMFSCNSLQKTIPIILKKN